MTLNKRYTFSIDYDAILDNGLKSKAGGWGRGLQTLAMLLGKRGHSVDIYTQQPERIRYFYDGVTFLDYGTHLDKEYDVVLWNGWVTDRPTQKGKLYIYLEFFRNWEHARPLQKDFLRSADNCIIGYPFSSLEELFLDAECEFKDKSFLFPYPVGNIEDGYNYYKSNWAVSLKEYQFPHRFKDNLESILAILNSYAATRNKTFCEFPQGDKPFEEVLKTLEQVQILFPFHVSGSTIEALLQGVVSLPVFKAEAHNQLYLPFGRSSIEAGTYLEYPLTKERFLSVLDYVLTSEASYIRTVDIMRKELLTNLDNVAVVKIENLLQSLL